MNAHTPELLPKLSESGNKTIESIEKERDELRALLRRIHYFAHVKCSGPADLDSMRVVRRMAGEAL